MDRDKLSKCRNEVIQKFINSEWIVNAIISQHYFKDVMKSFLLEVLYDEYCSFALKRRILVKILPDSHSKQIQNLNRMNAIRNYFAHCNQEFIDLRLHPKPEVQGKILDPRETSREIDFEALYAEFNKIEPEVAKYLFNVFKEKGGKLFQEGKLPP